jgi:hypothetical protein
VSDEKDPKKRTDKSGYRLVTLGELGPNLPIGLAGEGGRLAKDFEVKPFRFKEEREIEKLKNKPGLSVGAFVSSMLGLLVARVGSTDIEKLKDAERQLFFGQMWFCDVMYLYVYLRVEALGPVVGIDVPCRMCRAPFQFHGDLRGMDVRVVDDPQELRRKVALKTGLPLRSALRKNLTTRPVHWLASLNRDLGDAAQAKMMLFQHSVEEVEGIPPHELALVPESAFDELTKFDAEILSRHIEDSTPGPQMVIEAQCPRCQSQIVSPLNWSYDSFFGSSSL